MPLAFSSPTSTSRFRSHRQSPLGPIVGGVVAVFALILIFIYLVLLLLKRRSSQRHVEIVDPTSTPLDFVDTREGLGRHVSVNDDVFRCEIPRVPLARPTGALCFVLLSSSQLIYFSSLLLSDNTARERRFETRPLQLHSTFINS